MISPPGPLIRERVGHDPQTEADDLLHSLPGSYSCQRGGIVGEGARSSTVGRVHMGRVSAAFSSFCSFLFVPVLSVLSSIPCPPLHQIIKPPSSFTSSTPPPSPPSTQHALIPLTRCGLVVSFHTHLHTLFPLCFAHSFTFFSASSCSLSFLFVRALTVVLVLDQGRLQRLSWVTTAHHPDKPSWLAGWLAGWLFPTDFLLFGHLPYAFLRHTVIANLFTTSLQIDQACTCRWSRTQEKLGSIGSVMREGLEDSMDTVKESDPRPSFLQPLLKHHPLYM
ncbi:MAG: hypothetical protein J3Q66DRAFT_143017 [Benniella sp.]|nr:MAG: hypothetical protein J3Q66DRAFT_143017 [Benniella sp.]